jgi:hypothetical protein
MLSAVVAHAQTWTAIKPALFPTNVSGQIHGISRVSEMKYHPSDSMKMYAVSARGGLYLSTNQGNTWAVAPGCDLLAPSKRFSSVAIDPTNDQNIYLGISDDNYYSSGQGVYKSTNGGATFAATTLTSKIVTDIIIDPTNTNVILAATNTGVYKSINAGATWVLKSASISSREMVTKANTNSRVIFLASDVAFYRSNDFGETWTQITNGITTVGGGCRLGVTPADSQIVYFICHTGYGTIYKSRDGGNSFIQKKSTDTVSNLVGYTNALGDGGQGNYNLGFGVDRVDTNKLYFVAHNVWTSADGGVTWTQLTNWWAKVHTDMHQIFTSPYNNTKLWNMNDGGVWLSTDAGNNWVPKSDGIYGYEIYKGNCSPTRRDMITIGTQDNGELYGTSAGWFCNRGGDWGSDAYFDKRSNSSMVYYLSNGDRRLVSGGSSQYAPSDVVNAIHFAEHNKNVCYLSDTSLYLYRTNNLQFSGTPTWLKINAVKKTIRWIYQPPSDSNYLYAITNDGNLFKSTNALAATPVFNLIALPFSTNNAAKITGLSNDANKLYAIMNNRIYYSIDGGVTWINVTYNLPSVNHVNVITDFYYPTQNIVYIATPNAVYYKKGAAISWTLMYTGMPSYPSIVNMSVYDDGTSNSLLRLATYGRGVWEAPISFNRDFDAAFNSTDSIACGLGKVYKFNDVSNGTVVFRAWTFTGGSPSTSTAANPTITYSTPGIYPVSLIVFNGAISDTLTLSTYVNFVNECGLDTVPGKAMLFNGTASYIDVPTLPINTNTVTITAWVKIMSLQPAYSGIFMSNGTASGLNFKVSGTTNYIGCHWGGTSIWSNNSIDSIPRNKWTHVALVTTATNAKLYVNGKATTITTAMATANLTSTTSIIGRYQNWTSRNMNNALIDEVCVYNRSLSQNEIRELMHLTKKPSTDPNLIVYYQFNELPNTDKVYDKTSNQKHGSLVNCVRTTSTGPFGGGTSKRLTVSAAGTYAFTGTYISMSFPASATYPNGELVVSRINLQPDYQPNTTMTNARSYWIVNNYGSNTSFTAVSQIVFNNIGTVPALTGSSDFKLYKRSSSLDGNSWGSSIATSTGLAVGPDGTVTFNNPLITSFSMFGIVNEGTILPLNWLTFDVEKVNSKAANLLTWSFISYKDIYAFDIETSTNAVQFKKLDNLLAANNNGASNYNFQYIHNNPEQGLTYYRIKHYDKNGFSSYSNIKSINYTSSYQNHIQLFPNPIQNNQAVYFYNDWNQPMSVSIYNIQGKYITTRLVTNGQAINANLIAGVYFYNIQVAGQIFNGKLLVE